MSYFLKFFSVFIIFFSLLFFNFNTTNAQTSAPQFLVSWQAQSLVPSWYLGKIFPTIKSRISVKFDLVDNGKIIDISRLIIRWYVNDNLVINEKNGLGIRNYSFINNEFSGSIVNMRISVLGYKNTVLNNIVNIPVANPEVAINIPYADKKIKAGNLSFEAIPFFFKADNYEKISFQWIANNNPAQAINNSFLNLNISPNTLIGSLVDVSVLVKNLVNELEYAGKSVKLEVQ